MTKIYFLISFIRLPLVLVLTILCDNAHSQDSHFPQEAFRSCLEQTEVKPYLVTHSFNDQKNVLVVENTEIIPADLVMTVNGLTLITLYKQDLFFLGIKDFITLLTVSQDKSDIHLVFNVGPEFTCLYDSNKKKVRKLRLSK